MPRIRICKEKECKNEQTTSGYCRLHYLRNWKKVKAEQKKKAAKNLNRYIDSIMRRNPDRYIDEIKKDVRSSRFDEKIEETFGSPQSSEENWSLFDNSTSEEDLKDIIEQLKVDKDF